MAGAIVVACVVNIGVCFTWPVLEALVSEGETPAHVPHAVGIYNITWAATNALAFFIGGTLIEKFGYQSIFYVPLVFIVTQLAIVFWVQKIHDAMPASELKTAHPAPDASRPGLNQAISFRRMAWLANPFAYIAISTLIAVLPGIAAKFHLSPMMAGFACSLWCFARFFAFIALWQWTGWHYKFRWLAGAFGLLILSFAAILVVPNFAVLLAGATLFRRRHRSDLLFVACFTRWMPAMPKANTAASTRRPLARAIASARPSARRRCNSCRKCEHSGAIAVSALLLCGFGGLMTIWKNSQSD